MSTLIDIGVPIVIILIGFCALVTFWWMAEISAENSRRGSSVAQDLGTYIKKEVRYAKRKIKRKLKKREERKR